MWPRICGVLLLIAAFSAAVFWLRADSPEQLLVDARRSMVERKYGEAIKCANKVLEVEPNSIEALLIRARAEFRRGNAELAAKFYARLSPRNGPRSVAGIVEASRVYRDLGKLSDAESLILGAIKSVPGNVELVRESALLKVVTGRRWESTAPLFQLVKYGRAELHELQLLADLEQAVEEREFIHKCLELNSTEPLALTAKSTFFSKADISNRIKTLRTVIRQSPDLLNAHVQLGWSLLDLGDRNQMIEWVNTLPESSSSHPDTWIIKAAWAESLSQTNAARRCYWESLRRNPNSRQANYRLGKLLESTGQDKESSGFLDRAKLLGQLSELIRKTRIQPSAQDFVQVVEIMLALGRYWEAAGWLQFVQKTDDSSAWIGRMTEQLEPKLSKEFGQTAVSHNPAKRIDLSHFPLLAIPSRSRQTDSISSRIQFKDESKRTGLEFVYFNSPDESTPGARMFEATGGGLGVLDFDVDGWPDVYMTQGCPIPAEENHSFRNRMFWNQHPGSFIEVGLSADVNDNEYGQGVSVGDINNDGFPDLRIATLTRNKLYINNGDGTFTPNRNANDCETTWTTSCVIADLNTDGNPDIYDVNYLSGEDVYSRICETVGIHSVCHPSVFQAAQDCLQFSRGDGTFEDVTRASGIGKAGGKGLGVVVADFERSGRLSLFIANDTTANHFYRNLGSTFEESGVFIGLAYDKNGFAQACMGIACGDVGNDGNLDLFVTNFLDESNVLYVQHDDSFFLDETAEWGLRRASVGQLGFGTQFLDADLDGDLDLIVANGHIDDLSRDGKPYKMPTQFFVNDGNERFAEMGASTLGPYFSGRYLGRSIARLDWNRDGLDDAVVSHLDAPVALLTNTTPDAGNFLSVRLRGTKSSRDAIGSVVTVLAGGRQWTRQLTAGDGYQASNQRTLIFGLGAAKKLDEIRVAWPSGEQQVLQEIDVNSEVMIVEGQQAVFDLPKVSLND